MKYEKIEIKIANDIFLVLSHIVLFCFTLLILIIINFFGLLIFRSIIINSYINKNIDVIKNYKLIIFFMILRNIDLVFTEIFNSILFRCKSNLMCFCWKKVEEKKIDILIE